ncbi:tyrosyl-DNA phosphodiesterase 2 [Notothenia coriiceps]|uniref:Tyrosyl-DNA phosphodiesterase 2 n=1 Tax=Notothenia coriiceps TaxID=8208 RepID=A0A6I9NAI8_9TELE|nr:PREDICTED: tyrosyl-DNA phosphodiesterase 2 [Notothenia coriiceps]
MASTSASEKPSVSNVEENRSRLCSEFAAITGADSAVAQCYLVENEWEMQKAMNSFFEADLENVFEEDMSEDSESSSKRKRQKMEEKPPAEWLVSCLLSRH